MAERRVPLPRTPMEVVVDGFTHGGDGVARLEGKAVFVPGALPGETVTIKVTHDKKRWARADLIDVVEASDIRVTPPCVYVPECGGCDLQHATPEGQRQLKTRVVREQLERLGKITNPPVEDCREVGPAVGYRNHAQVHAGPDGKLGFHRQGSHDVVPIERCLILNPGTQAILDQLGDDTGAADVALRSHATTDSHAIVMRPGAGGIETPEGDFDVVFEQPDGSGITLRGEGVLAETVAGITFRFPASGFFQVNTAGAEAIVAAVREAAGEIEGALVWDLYAGVGLISLPLATDGAEVIAVEGHDDSAEWAEKNAEAAGVIIRVENDPVQDFVAKMAEPGQAYDHPDVVVLDPPRVGAGEDVCRNLASLQPGTIVYVACDVASLARDAQVLEAEGYTLRKAVPLDLFPMTHHVEVVATFTR